MCVYLFSPQKDIQIEYASESITLLAKNVKGNRPLTDVVLDLLITNKTKRSNSVSDNLLREIYIIYPRAFYDTEFYEHNGGEEQFKIVPGGSEIIDETETFRRPNHPYNRLLTQFPCKLIDEKGEMLNENSKEMISLQPDPSYPGKIIDYKGYINPSKVDFEPIDNLTDIQWRLLMKFRRGFTIFRCRFNEPIEYDKARWMRWHIIGPEWNDNYKDTITHWKNKIIDRVIANYHIIGNYDVLYQLKAYLNSFTMIPASKPSEKPMISAANDLSSKIDNLTQNADVKVMDWRIHVFPMDFWELNNINYNGDIHSMGDFPNVLISVNKEFDSQICYQWKTGEKYIPKNKQSREGKFHISFMIKDPNYLWRLFPIISLVIGSISFVIGFISLLLGILPFITNKP